MKPSTKVGVAAVAVATLAVGVLVAVRASGDDTQPVHATATRAASTRVVRTTLSDYWTETGTVGYGRQRTLHGMSAGVLTWLPRSGATIDRGQALYRVDERPVALLYGSTPLYRELGTVGAVGRDVKVLADNLTRLGYDIGDQPARGTEVTVHGATSRTATSHTAAATTDETATTTPSTPTDHADTKPSSKTTETPAARTGSYRVVVTKHDAVFTSALKAATSQWQRHLGMRPATGDVRVGDVLVQPGAVRVGALSAGLGDDATSAVMAVSDQQKIVDVPVDADRADDVRAAQHVVLTLPDSSTTPGTVSSVSTAVQTDDSQDSSTDSPKIDVVVVVDDASKLDRITSGTVQVRFTGTSVRGVLAVPVGALLALSGGGYGVQVVGGALTAVSVGLFANGMVQVSGRGLVAGTRVVTTS